MSYVLDAGNENSKVIHITSSDADSDLSSTKSFLKYDLLTPILTPRNQDTLVSLYSAVIPYSFYNIRQGINDKIYYSQVGSTTLLSLTIPQGSYTINSLQSKLKELFDTAINAATTSTITYNRTDMKFTYNIPQHSGVNQIYFNWGYAEGQGHKDGAEIALGFPSYYSSINTGFTSLESLFVPDVNGGVHSIHIRTNLSSKGSIDSQSRSFSTILGTIPIDVNFGGVLFFRPADAIHKIVITSKDIKNIIIRLTDDRDRLLDLNGLDFNITILIDHIKHGRNIERRIEPPLREEPVSAKATKAKRGRPPKSIKLKKDIPIPLIN